MSNYNNQAQGQGATGFDSSNTFSSGGLNNSTGREPFEDNTSTFAPSGTSEAALAGHLHGSSGNTTGATGHHHGHHGHHGHHHESSGLNTGATTTGAGYDNNQGNRGEYANTGSTRATRDNFGDDATAGAATGIAGSNLTGDNYRGQNVTGDRAEYGTTPEGLSRESGGRAAGTASDTGVGGGRDAAVAAVRQTGDYPGASQTGNKHYGTGEDLSQTSGNRAYGTGDNLNQTSGNTNYGTGDNLDRTSGTQREGAAGVGSGNLYGSNTAARDYDNSTTGLSSGAAGTDRFDTSRQHGVTSDTAATTGAGYGHDTDDKRSNDHKASGITRHGDDFTGGDTADSAYKNYKPTGLTGNETTTTGVHDQNLESTSGKKEGLLDKVKNVFGGHTNTTNTTE